MDRITYLFVMNAHSIVVFVVIVVNELGFLGVGVGVELVRVHSFLALVSGVER